MYAKRSMGITLIELLVAMLLIGIIMTALTTFFGNTTRASSQSVARAELQQETLNAQQLMAARIREAYYVFRPDPTDKDASGNIKPVVLNLPADAEGLTTNPTTGNTAWTINVSPILALILPPEKSNVGALTAATTNVKCDPSIATQADYCYRFYAYYLMPRSAWLAQAKPLNAPARDEANKDTMVLAEYKAYYAQNIAQTAPNVRASLPIASGKAALLAEYIRADAPQSFFTLSQSSNNDTLSATASKGGNVTVNLAVQRKIAGHTIHLPKEGQAYNVQVQATNLDKVAYNLSKNW